MLPEKRRLKILEYIKVHRTASIDEIAHQFDISKITARRDFENLSQKGVIKKVYGGIASFDTFTPEPVFLKRIYENKEDKIRIAGEAVKRIMENDIIFIESGSTCLELTKLLPNVKVKQVVTTGLHILNILADLKRSHQIDTEIICSGGILREEPDIFVGPQALRLLDDIKVDVAFCGIYAVSIEDGWMASSIFEAEILKKVIKSSKKLIGITVNSNFEKLSFAKIAPITVFDEIITNKDLDNEILLRYRNKVKVTVC
jgi:DeoR/GlpR family transcriptional regulator of sugar metabolism